MGTSFMRTILQNLCCNSPWIYAVFWKLEHQHEMVLVWEDGFYDTMTLTDPMVDPTEELCLESPNKILPSNFPSTALDEIIGEYPIGLAVAKMSSSSHVVGKGVVGKTAFTGKARWIYSENLVTNVFNSDLVPECQDEWLLQFAGGIKTVLLLPVMPHGVLQLGSVEMVAEDATPVAYFKNKFEAHMKASLYGSGFSDQLLSTMFNYSDNLDEASVVTTGKVIKDQNATLAVRDFLHSGPRFVADTLKTWSEVDFSQQPSPTINWTEPCQLLNKDHEPFTREGANMSSIPDKEYESTFRNLDFELHRFLETTVEDNTNPYAYEPSISGHNLVRHSFGDTVASYCTDVSGVGPIGFPAIEMEVGHLFEAFVANPSSRRDDNSSNKSSITLSNVSLSENLASSGKYDKSEKKAKVGECNVPCDFLTFEAIDSRINAAKTSTVSDKLQKKKSRLPVTRKRRARETDGQSPKPHDRQLIQERLKELRNLVPNSEKCSIDGLLDKAVNHILFLRNVTNRVHKLKRHKEKLDEMTRRKRAGVSWDHDKGISWAVELGSGPQPCPIVVKDLNPPGQMLILMACSDHDHFLEIADVFHRLQLTILESTMETSTGSSSCARFIVETNGSFHRLDVFWPLMKLVR